MVIHPVLLSIPISIFVGSLLGKHPMAAFINVMELFFKHAKRLSCNRNGSILTEKENWLFASERELVSSRCSLVFLKCGQTNSQRCLMLVREPRSQVLVESGIGSIQTRGGRVLLV